MRSLPWLLLLVPVPVLDVQDPAGDEVDPGTVRVPRGEAIELDGVVDPAEWSDARTLALAPAGEARVKHDGEKLYVALRTEGPLLGSLQVAGETLRVLHASASLGTVCYERVGDAWSSTGPPDWRCRASDDGEAAVAERSAFFEEHAWLASNMHRGPATEMEFELSVREFARNARVTLVLGALDPSAETPVAHWPARVADGSIERELLTGPFPEELAVELESWGVCALVDQRLDELED